MELESIESALFLANNLYGLEMNPDTFTEVALVAWNRIGNKYCRLYRCQRQIDSESLIIELPCNADFVEAVTYNFEDWEYSTNKNVNGDTYSQFTENYIESRKIFNDPLYLPGKLAKFKQFGNILQFDKNYGLVNILYKGIYVDDEGLPLIQEKERDAIACFVAMTDKFKQGWKANNPQIIQIAKSLEIDWKRLCDAARIPVYINQNEMNQILDAKVSANRKIFNKTYKPYN